MAEAGRLGRVRPKPWCDAIQREGERGTASPPIEIDSPLP